MTWVNVRFPVGLPWVVRWRQDGPGGTLIGRIGYYSGAQTPPGGSSVSSSWR